MAAGVKAIPDGYSGITPYLCVRGAAAALEFYKRAFGAHEVMRMLLPDGRIGHAELRIGGAAIMLADEFPDMGFVAPLTLGGTPVTIHLYVEDVDALALRAVSAGARVHKPIENQFYGDRAGVLEDPFGHLWWVATHKEDVPPEEMRRRADRLYGQT